MSTPGSPRSPAPDADPPPPPQPSLDNAASRLLDDARATRLAPGLAAAASAGHLDVGTLVTMRSGALSPHLPAPQRQRAREKLVKRLMKHAARLLARYGDEPQVTVSGKLDALARQLARALAPPAVAPPAAATGVAPGTINVVYETEEDRACSSPTYTVKKMHESILTVKKLYNLNIDERVLPSMKVVKRVAYYREQHGSWPDPLVVRLEDMRREASDSPATLFRLIYCVLTVSAGVEYDPTGVRKDEGASDLGRLGVRPQACNGNLVIKLMELVEAKRDVLSASRLMRLCETIHRTTFTATCSGSTSLSLALRSAWTMADMFAAMVGAQGDEPGPRDGASSPHRGPRSKPRASPPTPHTAPLAGKRSGGQGGGSAAGCALATAPSAGPGLQRAPPSGDPPPPARAPCPRVCSRSPALSGSSSLYTPCMRHAEATTLKGTLRSGGVRSRRLPVGSARTGYPDVALDARGTSRASKAMAVIADVKGSEFGCNGGIAWPRLP